MTAAVMTKVTSWLTNAPQANTCPPTSTAPPERTAAAHEVDQRGQERLGELVDDGGEGRADDDGDGELDDVAAQQEVLEAREHGRQPPTRAATGPAPGVERGGRLRVSVAVVAAAASRAAVSASTASRSRPSSSGPGVASTGAPAATTSARTASGGVARTSTRSPGCTSALTA